MADSKGKTPVNFWKNSSEDEPIIDLVDEIGGGEMLDLEKNLLDLEKEIGRSLGEEMEDDSSKAEDIPELASIAWTDMEEGIESPSATIASPENRADIGQPQPKMSDPDLNDLEWLLKDLNNVTSPGTDRVEEVLDSELSEVPDEEDQFLDAVEIPDDLSPEPAAAPSEPAAAPSEEDEALELLDVDESDDQLIWFDEFETRSAATEVAENVESEAFPPGLNDMDLIMRSAGAPPPVPAEAPREVEMDLRLPDFAPLAVAAGGLAATAISAPATTRKPDPDQLRVEISPEEIDAALERLIERKFAGRIEAIIIQTIEKAVSKEIERLKSLIQNLDP